MSNKFSKKLINSLLPNGSAFSVEQDSHLDMLLDGIADIADEVSDDIGSVGCVRDPHCTTMLSDLESEYGIQQSETLSDDVRRERLASFVYRKKNRGSVDDLQAALTGAGFNIQVHENSPAVDPNNFSWYNIFAERFTSLPLSWINYAGSGVESIQAVSGSYGGYVYRVGGVRWRSYPGNIPYHPEKKYRMMTRARRIATVDPTKHFFYCGVNGVAADGVTLVNAVGANSASAQHYICASNVDASAWPLNVWQDFTGWFHGHGTPVINPAPNPLTPSPLNPGVAYFRPMFITNLSGGPDGNVIEIDFFVIDVFENSELVVNGNIYSQKPNFNCVAGGDSMFAGYATAMAGAYFSMLQIYEQFNFPTPYNSYTEKFTSLPSHWNVILGSGIETIENEVDSYGGKILRINGFVWKEYPYNIPYHPEKKYRMMTRARRIATVDPTKHFFYCGVNGVSVNGTRRINAIGNNDPTGQHYICASNVDASAWPLNVWQNFTGWFQGHGTPVINPAPNPLTPSPLYAGVTYFRPTFAANYINSPVGNIVDIDYFVIDVFDAAPYHDNLIEVNPNSSFVFFCGGDDTRDAVSGKLLSIQAATVPAERENELKRLILKYKPMHTWCGLIINYT